MALTLAADQYVSLRHVKLGLVGSGGQLPPGWVSELLSEVEVTEIDHSGPVPTVSVRVAFTGEQEGNYVSLTLGPYAATNPGDIFLLRGSFTITEMDNIAQSFLLIREWESGGRFQRQATRPLRSPPIAPSAAIALEVREGNRVLQPVVTFQRANPGVGGSARLVISGLAFAKLYDVVGG